jgi:hypothetical protein
MGCVPAYMDRNAVRRAFDIKGNDCLDCLVTILPMPRINSVRLRSRSLLTRDIIERILLHTVYFDSSGLRIEEASGRSEGDVAATVPVWSAANGLHAAAAATAASGSVSSDATNEPGLPPGSCRAASNAASIAANGSASALRSALLSALPAPYPGLGPYILLRSSEVKVQFSFVRTR